MSLKSPKGFRGMVSPWWFHWHKWHSVLQVSHRMASNLKTPEIYLQPKWNSKKLGSVARNTGSFLFQVHMNFTRRPWHVLCPCTFRWSQVPVWRVLAAMKSPAIPKMSCHGLRKSVEELLAQLDRDEAREWEASWWGHTWGGWAKWAKWGGRSVQIYEVSWSPGDSTSKWEMSTQD